VAQFRHPLGRQGPGGSSCLGPDSSSCFGADGTGLRGFPSIGGTGGSASPVLFAHHRLPQRSSAAVRPDALPVRSGHSPSALSGRRRPTREVVHEPAREVVRRHRVAQAASTAPWTSCAPSPAHPPSRPRPAPPSHPSRRPDRGPLHPARRRRLRSSQPRRRRVPHPRRHRTGLPGRSDLLHPGDRPTPGPRRHPHRLPRPRRTSRPGRDPDHRRADHPRRDRPLQPLHRIGRHLDLLDPHQRSPPSPRRHPHHLGLLRLGTRTPGLSHHR